MKQPIISAETIAACHQKTITTQLLSIAKCSFSLSITRAYLKIAFLPAAKPAMTMVWQEGSSVLPLYKMGSYANVTIHSQS